MKTRTTWFDVLYTQNQLVLLAYFTDCSSLGIQFAPFLCFFELPTDVTFLHTQKIVHVSFPPPFFFLNFEL